MKIFNKEVSTFKAIVFGLIFLFVGYYFASPYHAVYNLRKSVDNQDVIEFSKYIDVTMLKHSFLRKMVEEGATSQELALNKAMINSTFSPSVILANLTISPDAQFDLSYKGFNRFVITNVNTGAAVYMKRDGLFHWFVYNYEFNK